MKSFLKKNAGSLTVLILLAVAITGAYWQGRQSGYVKALRKAGRQIDTTYIERTDTIIRYDQRTVHSIDSVPDTIIQQDVKYIARNTPCLADTTRTIVLSGGDSLVRTQDTLLISGRMHWRKQALSYKIPTKTITNTRVLKMYKGLHNMYLTASTNSSAGVMYGNRYFSAGYQYNWQLDQHVATIGVNLGMLWQGKKRGKLQTKKIYPNLR